MATTMSQKAAREGLGSPELFDGGVFVTKMVSLSCLSNPQQKGRRRLGNVILSAKQMLC